MLLDDTDHPYFLVTWSVHALLSWLKCVCIRYYVGETKIESTRTFLKEKANETKENYVTRIERRVFCYCGFHVVRT